RGFEDTCPCREQRTASRAYKSKREPQTDSCPFYGRNVGTGLHRVPGVLPTSQPFPPFMRWILPFLLGALLAGCSGQRDVTVIKLAIGLDSEHPVHKAMVCLRERLAEKSGGSMRVDVYPSGQLGTERENIELLQLGGLGMTKTSTSVLESFAAEYKVF